MNDKTCLGTLLVGNQIQSVGKRDTLYFKAIIEPSERSSCGIDTSSIVSSLPSRTAPIRMLT